MNFHKILKLFEVLDIDLKMNVQLKVFFKKIFMVLNFKNFIGRCLFVIPIYIFIIFYNDNQIVKFTEKKILNSIEQSIDLLQLNQIESFCNVKKIPSHILL